MDRGLGIGTSSDAYDRCSGPFNPEDLHREAQLNFNSHHFNTVEINHSHHQLPAQEECMGWKESMSG